MEQTLADITGYYPLNGAPVKTLQVEVSSTRLEIKTPSGVLVADDFYAPVKDSTWTVSDGTLELTLEKQKKQWWPHLLKGDPEIDVRKIEPERSQLSDLDGEAAAQVEKMMYDQRQQQQGLPTSDEQRKTKMLEKFKQQHPELDFSQLKNENINFK